MVFGRTPADKSAAEIQGRREGSHTDAGVFPTPGRTSADMNNERISERHDDGWHLPPKECFAPGTIIPTTAGEKDITEVRSGDRVRVYNGITGMLQEQEVIANVCHGPRNDLICVLFQAADNEKQEGLWVTPNHRLLLRQPGKNKVTWVSAGDIETGTDALLLVHGSDTPTYAPVRIKAGEPRRSLVFNLWVEGNRYPVQAEQGQSAAIIAASHQTAWTERIASYFPRSVLSAFGDFTYRRHGFDI